MYICQRILLRRARLCSSRSHVNSSIWISCASERWRSLISFSNLFWTASFIVWIWAQRWEWRSSLSSFSILSCSLNSATSCYRVSCKLRVRSSRWRASSKIDSLSYSNLSPKFYSCISVASALAFFSFANSILIWYNFSSITFFVRFSSSTLSYLTFYN